MEKKEPKKQTRAQLVAERRKVRDDLGADRDLMRAPTVPGKVFRWVNVQLRGGVNRVESLKKKGWELYDGDHVEVAAPNGVTEANVSEGSGGTMVVGLGSDGKPLHAVLMYINEDIYQVDQELKHEAIREQERALMNAPDAEGMYGSVKIGNI